MQSLPWGVEVYGLWIEQLIEPKFLKYKLIVKYIHKIIPQGVFAF